VQVRGHHATPIDCSLQVAQQSRFLGIARFELARPRHLIESKAGLPGGAAVQRDAGVEPYISATASEIRSSVRSSSVPRRSSARNRA